MFWGEECVHIRGAGCGDAAVDGADSSSHPADAYGHPIPHYVPSPGWLRHEHPSSAHPQTGQWTENPSYWHSYWPVPVIPYPSLI